MLDTAPLLLPGSFPALRRGHPHTLQVNLGYLCNQSCQHCHVNAGPGRTELMARDTVDEVLALLERSDFKMLDLTGGAPELNPEFRYLVEGARRLGIEVMDRCNLTVLFEPEQEDLAGFLARQRVHLVSSLPCYLKENVDRQRGEGVYERSLQALQVLNGLGYGQEGSGLLLDLVFNPAGPLLPASQCELERDYKKHLMEEHGIRFNRLLTLTNMPIQRFGSMLLSQGKFHDYLELLKSAHLDENLDAVMCRADQLAGAAIRVGDHCFGCTAGQGSSCGGALS